MNGSPSRRHSGSGVIPIVFLLVWLPVGMVAFVMSSFASEAVRNGELSAAEPTVVALLLTFPAWLVVSAVAAVRFWRVSRRAARGSGHSAG